MAYLILQYVILWNRHLELRVCGRSLSLTCVPQGQELGAEKVGWALLVPFFFFNFFLICGGFCHTLK